MFSLEEYTMSKLLFSHLNIISKLSSPKKGTCKGDKCSYYQGYTEGSSISGLWFDDFVRLGDTLQNNPPVRVKMGCHNNENKLFFTQKANGIFGLAGSGGGDLRTKPTILHDFLVDREHVNKNVFSMCMSQQGGRLIVGGYNSTYHKEPDKPITYVPLGPGGKFYVGSFLKVDFSKSGPFEVLFVIVR